MRDYEMLVVVASQLAEDDLTSSLDQITTYITNLGGAVTQVSKDNPWGRRRLAYPIRYNGQDVRDGFYALYHFQADTNRIVDLERSLRLNDRVLRHMVVKPDDDE